MALDEKDIAYFNRGKTENRKFRERFDNPVFGDTEATVLEVGCGYGSLCIDAALAGARKVMGIDLDARRIEFAKENLHINYPALTDKVDFRCIDLAELEDVEQFDVIVSKDTFEHIVGLDSMLEEMAKRLKKGGRVYAGFGPLYNSPFGDHRRTRAVLPWFHLIIPEPVLLRRINKKRARKVASIEELGLNKHSLKEYRELFQQSSLSIVSFKVNCSNNPVSQLFTLISKIPGLEEYFSHNIYCILQK